MRIVNPTAVLGENAACDYLLKKGYKILERNFRKGYGEIDLVFYDSNGYEHREKSDTLIMWIKSPIRVN